jgi:hypothetical protein
LQKTLKLLHESVALSGVIFTREQLQVVLDMKATHIRPSQRNYVVNRHVLTPRRGVDGIDDLPIRPSGHCLLSMQCSQVISLQYRVAVPAVLFAFMPAESFRVFTPFVLHPDSLTFPNIGMALR